MAISRMQQPRQQYGLGSLVKKAVRGVKKIVKSPIGKAAILGGLGMYGMGAGPFSGMKGSGFLKGIMAGKGGLGPWTMRGVTPGKGGFFGNMLGGAKNWWGGLSGGQKLFTGLAGASLAAPFLMGKGDEEEDVVEEAWTSVPSSIADIRNQAKNYYKIGSAGSNLNFMPGKQFVNANYYAADGGRVGLLNGGEAGQEQIEQMLMAEFVKYKNQGGTLTFEQFVQAVMQAQQQQPEGAGMEQPQEVAMAANGGRMGFKDGKSWWDNFKSSWGQVLSGETEAFLGGDQKKINEILTGQGWGIDLNPETIKMIIDGHKKGLDISTISSLAETDEGTVENIIEKLSFANGGPVPGSTVPGYTTPAGHNRFDYYSGGDPVRTGYSHGGQTLFGDIANIDWGSNLKDLGSSILDLPGEAWEILKDFPTGIKQIYFNLKSDREKKNMLEILHGEKKAQGGRIGALNGGLMSEDEDEYAYNPQAAMRMYKRQGKQEGGIMETEVADEMIDMGGQEKDYRETGGFVEIGGKERADDVPARLSKNEFVFTADAVRAAGGGDIDAGSEVMQNMMDNLEAGGEISEESQGLEGAQAMYDQQQMLQSRIA